MGGRAVRLRRRSSGTVPRILAPPGDGVLPAAAPLGIGLGRPMIAEAGGGAGRRPSSSSAPPSTGGRASETGSPSDVEAATAAGATGASDELGVWTASCEATKPPMTADGEAATAGDAEAATAGDGEAETTGDRVTATEGVPAMGAAIGAIGRIGVGALSGEGAGFATGTGSRGRRRMTPGDPLFSSTVLGRRSASKASRTLSTSGSESSDM